MHYVMYGLSLFLAGGPLIYILYKKQFATYFPYFIASVSFIALDLIGSLSSNITGEYNYLGFYAINLITSLGFCILFFCIKKMAIGRFVAINVRIPTDNLVLMLKKNRNFLFSAAFFSLLGMLFFSIYVSPPFFLITKSLEQKPLAQMLKQDGAATAIPFGLQLGNHQVTPPVSEILTKIAAKTNSEANTRPAVSTQPETNTKSAVNTQPETNTKPEANTKTLSSVQDMGYSTKSVNLLISRISIVASRPFHWFALVGFELPMFLSVLTFLGLYFVISQKGARKLRHEWMAYMLAIFVISFTASFWILSKQYSAYLVAALFLSYFVCKNHIAIRYISLLLFFFLTAFLLLYHFYSSLPLHVLFYSVIYHRIFEVYPWISAIVYSLFPGTYQYLDGQSVPNILHVANYHFVSLSNLIYPYIYMTIGGSAPVPAIFESYANWGWLGVLGSELIIFLTVFGVTVLSWSKNLFLIAVAIYMSVKLVLLWQAPFWFGFFESTGILFYILLFGAYKLFYGTNNTESIPFIAK